MSLFLSKLLPALLYPLGLAILLGVVGLMARRFRRMALLASVGSVVLLWVTAMPAFSNWVCWQWETPAMRAEDLTAADAIVVLGGVLRQEIAAARPQLGSAADRLFAAAELFRAGKAPHVVIAAGNVPWQASEVVEAVAIARLLVDLGVPREVIVLESASRNTHENAVNAAAIFRENGWRTALLVTSADHMRRALGCFRQAGIEATAAAADAHGRSPAYVTPLDLLPDADALARTTSVVKEVIGLIYYRARGWL